VTDPGDFVVPAASGVRPSLPTDVASLPDLGTGYATTLADGLRSLDLTLSPGASAAIDAQARLLVAWNQHINLTAIRTPDGIARLHVLDSLSAVPVLRERLTAAPAVMDLGSGGGYPGLPLAVALPAARLTLVDSVVKKTRFLEVVADAAREALARNAPSDEPHPGSARAGDPEAAGPFGVVIEVIAARAEQLAADHHRESWDVVLARAVGTLAEVVELGLPLLRRGGLLVCWKRDVASPRSHGMTDGMTEGGLSREIRDAGPLVTELGGDPPEVVQVDHGGLPGHRLVLVHKAHPTPRRFPRLPAERRRRLLR
jgi:16S rRNA (guanine527-N7)-methyltransferase